MTIQEFSVSVPRYQELITSVVILFEPTTTSRFFDSLINIPDISPEDAYLYYKSNLGIILSYLQEEADTLGLTVKDYVIDEVLKEPDINDDLVINALYIPAKRSQEADKIYKAITNLCIKKVSDLYKQQQK